MNIVRIALLGHVPWVPEKKHGIVKKNMGKHFTRDILKMKELKNMGKRFFVLNPSENVGDINITFLGTSENIGLKEKHRKTFLLILWF